MKVEYGKGTTKYGPGVNIKLDGNEISCAIMVYLMAHDITINGARTIKINNELIDNVNIYVDPSGNVIANGKEYSGRGEKKRRFLYNIKLKLNDADEFIVIKYDVDHVDSKYYYCCDKKFDKGEENVVEFKNEILSGISTFTTSEDKIFDIKMEMSKKIKEKIRKLISLYSEIYDSIQYLENSEMDLQEITEGI